MGGCGFFVLEKEAISYIADDQSTWEQDPLIQLAADKQLTSYFHNGFWHAMDTLRDRNHLEKLWKDSLAPWKSW